MDMKEFHELAAELGTYPPLTEAERLEGLKQARRFFDKHLPSRASYLDFVYDFAFCPCTAGRGYVWRTQLRGILGLVRFSQKAPPPLSLPFSPFP